MFLFFCIFAFASAKVVKKNGNCKQKCTKSVLKIQKNIKK